MEAEFVIVDKPGLCSHEYRNELLWDSLNLQMKQLCCFHSQSHTEAFRNSSLSKFPPEDLLVPAFRLKSFPTHRVCNYCFYNRSSEKLCPCPFFISIHYGDYTYPGNWTHRVPVGTLPVSNLCCASNHLSDSKSVYNFYTFDQFPSHRLCQECYISVLREDQVDKLCMCQFRLLGK